MPLFDITAKPDILLEPTRVAAPEVEPDPDDTKLNETSRIIGPMTHQGFSVKYAYRRAFSEMELLDAFDGVNFEPGQCWVCLTRGDVDLISYLKIVARQQRITSLGLSTWNANLQDFETLATMKRNGKIGSITAVLGIINKYGSENRHNVTEYRRILGDWDDVTVKVAKTHIKAFWGSGEKFPFVITGSANLNTNVNMEAVCILIDDGARNFYDEFFKDVRTLI